MKKNIFLPTLFIFIIISVTFFLRIYDINWDMSTHIHPDERFLTMVGNAMKIPTNFAEYFNPSVSKMNPSNIDFTFFVYGVFPLILTKIYAVIFNFDTYDKFNILGRGISALFDTLTVIAILRVGFIFKKRYNLSLFFPYLCGFFYAIAVFPIQQSHFFTVDTFANFFAFAALMSSVIYWDNKKYLYIILSAIFFGAALACKITSGYIAPLIVLFICTGLFNKYHPHISFKKFLKTPALPFITAGVVYLFFTYLTVRVTDPYMFQTGNFFNISINKIFLTNLETLKSYASPTAWYPPNVQWVHKTPVIFGVKNMALYGIGIVYSFFALLGIFFSFTKYRKTFLIFLSLWCLGIIVFQGFQYVQAMRYYFIVYPILAILAAVGSSMLIQKNRILLTLVILASSIWTAAFFSIYTKPLSRVSATMWINNTISHNNLLLGESWDDPLPLLSSTLPNKGYSVDMLPVFDPDTAEKWATMYSELNKASYYILSSNRAWGSIPTVPEKYPLMTKFYHDLFANRLPYKKVTEFTSYPSLQYLGIPLTFPDDSSDESFTVYDHPKVVIFKNSYAL